MLRHIDSDLKQLKEDLLVMGGAVEKAIEEERRKSMIDEQKVKQLQKMLEAKVEEAGANYEKFIAAQ